VKEKNVKTLLFVCLAALIAIGLVACGNSVPTTSTSEASATTAATSLALGTEDTTGADTGASTSETAKTTTTKKSTTTTKKAAKTTTTKKPAETTTTKKTNASTTTTAKKTTTTTQRPAFSSKIDNPYLPLRAGTKLVYMSSSERTVTEITPQTKIITGVPCIVVHDRAYNNSGALIEETYDWYSQDRDGNVWYYGEDTKIISGGHVVSRSGSWTAGVAGAQPGIIMKAHPAVGDSYSQEYLKGEAEDHAAVLKVGETITVSGKTYKNCVRTKEWSPLQPGLVEEKVYAPGVGCVLDDHEALVP
jgi:hypothetical protein